MMTAGAAYKRTIDLGQSVVYERPLGDKTSLATDVRAFFFQDCAKIVPIGVSLSNMNSSSFI